MAALKEIVVSLIEFFYGFSVKVGFPSYAFAIIILTILIKLILLPLGIKQARSMKNMQKIQPQMEQIQKKYKNNKEKQNKEIMELYQKYNINPAAGCFPLLLQMPIIFALFNTLRTYTFEPLEHATFFWIDNLTSPDPLYILPVLVSIATYFQSKFTMAGAPQTGQANMMLYMMPLMIGYISMKFPAGLCLYWVVFNAMGVVQQYIMNRLPDSI